MIETTKPVIALLTGNDVLSDARVLKYISTATSLGLQVHALGVTRSGPGFRTKVGSAVIEIVGVTPPPRSRVRAARSQIGSVLRWRYRTTSELFAARSQVARWRASASSQRNLRHVVLSIAAIAGSIIVKVVSATSAGSRSTSTETAYDHHSHRIQVDRLLADSTFAWTTHLGHLLADEAKLAPLLDELKPDIIHVHDVFMIATGAHACERAKAAGRSPALVYDAHEYVRGLSNLPPELTAAFTHLEMSYVDKTDAIVTVSEPLARKLQTDYNLADTPTVVLNAPQTQPVPPGFATLRETIAVSSAPLMVYAGGVNVARGVDTAVRALPQLPGVHLAIVTNKVNVVVSSLQELARHLGVNDRVHLANYVDAVHVVDYVKGATVGLSTLLHSPNHDVAITNKFCEYVQAGLPILTSDTPAQQELVEQHGAGEVYIAGDVDDFVAAARRIIANPDTYRARLGDDSALRARLTWAAQEPTIATVYGSLLGDVPKLG